MNCAVNLTRNGEPVYFVYTFDDGPNALDSAHGLWELVRTQVNDVRNGARRTY